MSSLRIYVDHGEAYGNLGDEAMLLNALRRLDIYLGPCDFVLPAETGRPLPLGLKNVTTVPSPYSIFSRAAGKIQNRLAPVRGIPLLKEHVNWDILSWRLAAKRLTAGAKHDGDVQALIDTFQSCDAFYGVGAADFSDFWLQGILYKSWLYKTVRPFVKVSALSSQGIGPLATSWARREMARAFSTLDLLSFRDFSESQAIVTATRPEKVEYRVTGDEAFTLPPSTVEKASNMLSAAGLPVDAPFVAVHFRTTDYTRETFDLIPRVARLLDRLSNMTDYSFVFLPMSYHLHSHIDQECGRLIREKMALSQRLLLLPECRDVTVIKRIVGMARFSLGLSYHIHVFSLSQGHPALILYTGDYYRYKSDGLLGFYGEPNSALDLNTTEDGQVLTAVAKIEGSYEQACLSIIQVNEEINEQNDWLLKEMQKRLL